MFRTNKNSDYDIHGHFVAQLCISVCIFDAENADFVQESTAFLITAKLQLYFTAAVLVDGATEAKGMDPGKDDSQMNNLQHGTGVVNIAI